MIDTLESTSPVAIRQYIERKLSEAEKEAHSKRIKSITILDHKDIEESEYPSSNGLYLFKVRKVFCHYIRRNFRLDNGKLINEFSYVRVTCHKRKIQTKPRIKLDLDKPIEVVGLRFVSTDIKVRPEVRIPQYEESLMTDEEFLEIFPEYNLWREDHE